LFCKSFDVIVTIGNDGVVCLFQTIIKPTASPQHPPHLELVSKVSLKGESSTGEELRLTAASFIDDDDDDDRGIPNNSREKKTVNLAVGSSNGDMKLVTIVKDENSGRIVLSEQQDFGMTLQNNPLVYALACCNESPSASNDFHRIHRRLWIGHASGLESVALPIQSEEESTS
jgi:hypothetical protein